MSVRRRDFLKVIGATGAAATVGCGTGDVERLIPFVVQPDGVAPGISTYYATTCRECGLGCGVLAEARDGRAFKLDGNPVHPLNRGAICSRGLAAVQGLYNPDRYRGPMMRRNGSLVRVSWDDALASLAQRLTEVRGGASARNALFITSPDLAASRIFIGDWLEAHGLGAPVYFDPLHDASVIRAHREIYGAAWPRFDFQRARLIVSFGADFLEGWGASIRQQLDYAAARAQLAQAPRHVYIGPRRSLTGLNADGWIPARAGSELAVARALAGAVGGTGSLEQAASEADVDPAALRALAAELSAARPSLVLAGASATNAYQLAIAVGQLNRSLGNIGTTIVADRPALAPEDVATVADMAGIARRMADGQVPLLMVRGSNPVFTLPPSAGFAEAMARVPFKVSFSSFPDETTVQCDLVLPDNHALESWDMVQTVPGTIAMQQPAMEPVFETRHTPDVLLELVRRDPSLSGRYPQQNFREWIIARFPGSVPQFTEALTQGLATGSLGITAAARPAAAPPATAPAASSGDFHLVVYPHAFLGDGSGANKPWLQEIPDPVTKISWQTTVEIHPSTAARLGIDAGDLVEVATDTGSLTAPAYLYPGVRGDTVAVALGRGHTAYGRYAAGVGANPLTMLPVTTDPASGALARSGVRARLRRTGGETALVSTEGSARQHGRGIARAIPVGDLDPNGRGVLAAAAGEEHADEIAPGGGEAHEGPAAAHGGTQAEHGGEGAHGFMGAAPGDYLPGLRSPVANDAEGALGNPESKDLGMYDPDHWSRMASRRWAMTIDLAKCTGCSACITACYSENNIPHVGADHQATAFPMDGQWGANIVRGREMTWLRLERYYEGGERMAQEFVPDFETRFVPMLCQHCGNAPCEPVCPVYATYHAPDGLNVQVYNRCVGTRYCSNNCPYKVRYFNWFGYGEPDRPQYAWPEPLNLALNPDVTVRGKGVMEKCTFCIQRIREAENRAALEGRPVMADEFTTACAQACPSRAIVFGDAADASWSIASLLSDPRSYTVFEELKTFAAVVYLKKVNHPAPTAPGAA